MPNKLKTKQNEEWRVCAPFLLLLLLLDVNVELLRTNPHTRRRGGSGAQQEPKIQKQIILKERSQN